jgi:hypothetical protein
LLLRDSALEETAGVRWSTVSRQQFVLAQGTGQIAVLESVIKYVYREMRTVRSISENVFFFKLKLQRVRD